MKKRIKIWGVGLLLLVPFHSYSTHLVGGEINYQYLGSNNYNVQINVYRDCYNGIPPFDNPLTLGIYDVNNNLLNTYDVNLGNQLNFTDIASNCIQTGPYGFCYEVGRYSILINLPPIAGGYQLVYQRCCVSNALVNIVSPTTTGFTLSANIPDSIAYNNSSPQFNKIPATSLCIDNPFTLDYSAHDDDGDSLVYSLTTPLAGGSVANPLPVPPDPPPYIGISWFSPYSLSNIMGGDPLQIDSVTGILTGTPNSAGLFEYCVSVAEYRDGIFLDETKRIFLVNVFNTTSVQEIENKFVSCFPNPFHEKTILRIDDKINIRDVQLEVNNLIGEKIKYISNIESHEISFNQGDLAPGIYFYHLSNAGKLFGNGKLIVN